MSKPKLFLICTGLGTVNRGFESYISGLAEKLELECRNEFETIVLAGGPYKTKKFKSLKIPCIRRNLLPVRVFIKDLHRAFFIEQITFFFSLVPYLILTKPTAIYLGEYNLYCYLFKLRKLLGLKYRLMLYTGGQAIPGLYNKSLDFVHHVTNVYIDELNAVGYPTEKQFLIPHFVSTSITLDDSVYREIKKLSKGKKIILSVGTLDNKVKKFKDLTYALAPLSKNVFPIFLGNKTHETTEIENALKQCFGLNNYLLHTVAPGELPSYYSSTDLFVLASSNESFGLVLLEALLLGKPVMCQPFKAAPYVTKGLATYLQKDEPLSWTEQIRLVLNGLEFPQCIVSNNRFVKEFYSWEGLGSQYKSMFRTLVL